MKNYKIIADSSCDVPQIYRDKYDIDIVPFYYTFDKVNYGREGVDIELEDFYDLMLNKNYPLTGQPTIMDYTDKFEPYASKGQDILCICLTSKFSGSYNSAVNAAEMMKEAYPDVEVIGHFPDEQQDLTTSGPTVQKSEELTAQSLAEQL